MYARFGQELYIRETLIAATILADVADSADAENSNESGEAFEIRDVVGRIAGALSQGTLATRQRIAVKLLQRMIAGAGTAVTGTGQIKRVDRSADENGGSGCEKSSGGPSGGKAMERLHEGVFSFARLMAHLPDTQARRELVFYAAARADGLIGAIAREILYPYFIEECIPAPYEEDEFIMANAGLLLAPEPILTAGLVADYARLVWGFDSERTISLALRILRQAGILLSAPLLGERGRVAAYTLAPHGISLPTLLWGLHDQYAQQGIAPAWDQVGRAQCARLFVVPPGVVAAGLWEAERAGVVGFWNMVGTRRVLLKVRETDALSRLLLTGPYAK